MANPNLSLLVGMAQAMGSVCDRVVFVGGCATGLLLSNADLMDVRATEDVDAIVEVATLAGYHALAKELMNRGFKQTMEDNTPPFRWYWQRMQLDLVPLDEKSAGLCKSLVRHGLCRSYESRGPSRAGIASPVGTVFFGNQVRSVQ